MLRLLHKTLFEKAHRFHGLKLDQILPGVSSIVAKFSTTNAKRSEGKWISKLDYAQEIFNYGHRLGTRLNVPVFILHSRKPLQYDDVYRAMQHLVKRSSIFNMVIRERDGELWWNMQDEAKVDFKMHDNGRSMYEVLEDIWTEGFDETNGPLWKSRLVKADEEDKFVTPEIKRDYPHRYYLMTVPHHGLFGGQSSARCTTPMLQAINAVIDGEPMDKVAPFGEYVPNSAYAETESMFREKLLTDPERLEAVKEYCTKSSKKSYLLDYYPPPKVDKATSKHCYIDFDLQTMKKFIANAKKNGITYGNAVQNVTTTAYVEMLQEAGATNDVFDISVGMAADTYRYLEKRDLPILGLHIKQMASYMSLSRNPREKFWEHCHVLQKLNKELIKSGYAFEQDVISDLFIPRVPTCEVFKLKPVTRDFGFTSIGNMDYVINGEGKHVQITHIVSFTSVHDYIFPFFQQIFTFRANEVNMMYYDSARISDDTMNHLIDRSLSVIAQYSK